MKDLLEWLQQIYAEDFCNGSWEHEHGVTIDTLDPGWYFKFDLIDTTYDEIPFQKLLVKKDETDWYQCWIKDGVFHGWGGPRNLSNILEVFRDWYLKADQILTERENE